MTQTSTELLPYDLLSHFVTHSYLSLIEKLALSSSHSLNQPLRSFLFICHHNHQHTHILQTQIFDYYTATHPLSPAETLQLEMKNNPLGAKIFYPLRYTLSFKNLNKAYSKQLLKAKKPLDTPLWQSYNLAYIHLHQSLVYHTHNKSKCHLPVTLTPNADLFITHLLEYYKDLSS